MFSPHSSPVSLKRQLFLMAFFACLPALLVAIALGVSEVDAAHQAAHERARLIALSVRQTLDHELDTTIALLKELARSRSLEQASDPEDFGPFYAEAVAFTRSWGHNLALLAPDGRQLFNTLRPLGTPLPSTNNPQSMTQVIATGQAAVTNVFNGALLQQPLIGFDVPVSRNDQVRYVLRLVLLAEELQRLAARATLPTGWGMAILDANGRFVARSRNPATGQLARPGLPEAIARHTEGWVDTVTREGIPVTNLLLRSEISPWTVVIGIPQQDLSWPVVRFSLLLLATMVGLLAAAAALSTFFGYRIVSAIGRLASDQEEGATGIVEIDAVTRRLREIQAGLRESEHRMRLAKESAEEANAAKSRFLAAMSHELRTPLNAIIGFGDLLLTKNTNPHNREYIGIIKSAGNTLLKLIQDILDLSKIETGKVTLHLRDFDLAHELDTILAQFGVEVMNRQLALKLTLDPALPSLMRGDPDLLRQILLNLIGNAVKFTEHGHIELQVEPRPPLDGALDGGRSFTLVFHVHDTGIGIRPENQQRIFDMFEQEEDSITRRFGGAGLGLAISRKLVSLLGGELWLHSEHGVGSCFSFTARFDPPAAPLVPAGADPTPASAPALSEGEPLILVVEDDPASQLLLTHLLSMNHYRVHSASDGAAALDFLRQPSQRVAAILMDIQLPILSGAEVTRRIRAGEVAGCSANLPIIAVTAYALAGDREKFLALGMNEYLPKPIDGDSLLATLARFV